MPHNTELIAILCIGFVLAFVLGMLAQRLKLSPLVGYLVAGMIAGPFTPGFVADQTLAPQLAEVGVILLMFGVGLHFSARELVSVKAIAVPGALVQIAVATGAGTLTGAMLGWGIGAGLIFGLALSVASTVVLLRALQERGLVQTERGRIAVGWLVVEDLAMVLALVMIPPLAGVLGGTALPVSDEAAEVARMGLGPVAATLLVTGVKVSAFFLVMLLVGRRLIPWLLDHVAQSGSRELFRLAVLAIALGVAFGSSAIFGVSFALGAFFAGMVMAGSTLSAQAMKDVMPLRDAFAVLFFVSVGMLFNPQILIENPGAVLMTILVILVVKSAAAWGIMRLFGHPDDRALTIAASLAQIGEFSFILIVMGVDLAIVPPEARDLVVAGAMASILVNPLLFRAIDRRFPLPRPATSAVDD